MSGLLDVTPVRAAQRVPNRRTRNAEDLGQCRLRHFAGRVSPSQLNNVRFRQLRSMVGLTTLAERRQVVPALHHSIASVVAHRAKKQMVGPDARRVVATMADHEIRRDRTDREAVSQLVTDPVREQHPSPAVQRHTDLTVPAARIVAGPRSSPNPAVTASVDAAPEALLDWNRSRSA